ncbi:tRNA-uridine aminocarboxypropyltransferase 1 isoform X4 [Dermacentor variabilis]|uniref:tRNA-uridine aminocarboxypropyltransferase 1 isoform X4 n=1 Tax=Dermacentor variabilis TaxID=34621 RepID=UPI003F5BD48E
MLGVSFTVQCMLILVLTLWQSLELPMQIAILKHAGEVDGKSTAAHLPVLAPDHVKIYTFPNIPAFDPNEVLLLFPGENAQPFEKLWKSRQNGQTAGPCVICAKEHFNIPWKTLIFIDSTWKQTKRIYLDAKIKGLPCAVLEGGRSAFWRPQRGKPSSWLATAEAVHLAVTQLLALQGCAGHVDDLLFFFKFFYARIRSRYSEVTWRSQLARNMSGSKNSENSAVTTHTV